MERSWNPPRDAAVRAGALISEELLSSSDTQICPPPRAAAPRAIPPPPPQAGRQLRRPPVALWMAVLTLLATTIGLGFFLFQKAGRFREGSTGERIPARAVLHLIGEAPEHSTWKVGGAAAALAHPGENFELPLPAGAALPLEVLGEAIGYRPFRFRLTALRLLSEPVAMTFERTQGTLVLTRRGPSDYGNVSAQMTGVLAGEAGHVPVSRVTRNCNFPADGPPSVRWLLPTGVYQLSLGGTRNSVITRLLGEVTVREEGEETCLLPPSFAGRYVGKVMASGSRASPSGESATELLLRDALNDGELGINPRFILERIRINSKGVLTATAKVDAQPPPEFDRQVTAQLSSDGDRLEIRLVEIFDPERQAILKRPALRESEWTQTGTLERRPADSKAGLEK